MKTGSLRALAVAVAVALVLGPWTLPAAEARPTGGLAVEDVFGRTLNEHGLVLVDWEGYMANPVIRFFVRPPTDAVFPARVVVTASESRLYFDLPSQSGPDGPRKEIDLPGPGTTPVSISIFPDRDGRDEDHPLKVEFLDAEGRSRSISLPVHVVDQDQDQERGTSFPITVDFSEDRTGFFQDEARRSVVVRAAEDWVYFFDGAHLDPTPAGAETTLIWNPDGFNSSRPVTNERAYTGYLLYAYGIDSPMLRSGGEPSRLGGFQTEQGQVRPTRRSGGYEAEIKGNYNRMGWLVGLDDPEWWKATNLGGVENDLYSVAHHEIGHALIFNPVNTRFGLAKVLGRLRDDRLRAYLGSDPKIDRADHLDGSIDPVSLRGAFGNEYHGRVPFGRWLVTKLDLLAAQAVGYTLRETSAFLPLEIRAEPMPEATVLTQYTARLRASGGVPFYDWSVVEGALPEGMALDPFSGEIQGIPKLSGDFEFTVRVRDYGETVPTISRPLRLKVSASRP